MTMELMLVGLGSGVIGLVWIVIVALREESHRHSQMSSR